MQIDGTIIAPGDPSAWKCPDDKCLIWIEFSDFRGLLIRGSGTINGQGKKWWDLECKENKRVRILRIWNIWKYEEK